MLSLVFVSFCRLTQRNPWENVCKKSFNGKLRDELLNREIFCTLGNAKIVIRGRSTKRFLPDVASKTGLQYRRP